ncbi:hypothetical protein V8B97DRAFT_1919737 [Scleroderma yunnanense]
MPKHRFGIENEIGVGGGIISAESQRKCISLEIAEDLCNRRKPKKALPYLFKAMEDENNLDAFIQSAFLHHLPEAVKVLEQAEEKGREALKCRLGRDCFDDGSKSVGHFYELIVTRPYIRVLQAQVRLYFENGQPAESAYVLTSLSTSVPSFSFPSRAIPTERLSLRCFAFVQATIWDSALGLGLYSSSVWLAPDRPGVLPRGGATFGPPSSTCFDAKVEDQLSSHSNGAMAYNAAVAAFKLFGDCNLARQYLRIAAKVNPIILIKILAQMDKPRGLNMMPRTHNGAEDAQDYLFLTQDVWMKDDVWAWANGTPEAKNNVLKPCANGECGAIETKVAQFKRCGACKQVVYCSQTCQRGDWKTHKPRCQQRQQIKNTIRAVYSGRPAPEDAIPTASADFVGGGVVVQTHVGFDRICTDSCPAANACWGMD